MCQPCVRKLRVKRKFFLPPPRTITQSEMTIGQVAQKANCRFVEASKKREPCIRIASNHLTKQSKIIIMKTRKLYRHNYVQPTALPAPAKVKAKERMPALNTQGCAESSALPQRVCGCPTRGFLASMPIQSSKSGWLSTGAHRVCVRQDSFDCLPGFASRTSFPVQHEASNFLS